MLGSLLVLQVKIHKRVAASPSREDSHILRRGVHIVVGTPGRVHQLLQRRILRAEKIKVVVLDEAANMLSDLFKDPVGEILRLLPPKLQVSIMSRCQQKSGFIQAGSMQVGTSCASLRL